MRHEYKLLRCRDEIYLSEAVTKCLAEGWNLWGNPFMVSMDMENGWICQAVIRQVGNEPAKEFMAEQPVNVSAQVPNIVTNYINNNTTSSNNLPILINDKPIVQHARPLFYGRLCACLEKEGDNPDCLLHFDHSGEPVISGMVS